MRGAGSNTGSPPRTSRFSIRQKLYRCISSSSCRRERDSALLVEKSLTVSPNHVASAESFGGRRSRQSPPVRSSRPEDLARRTGFSYQFGTSADHSLFGAKLRAFLLQRQEGALP